MMTDWDTEEWTRDAKELIDWIRTVSPEHPLLLMIRHSHRGILRTYEDTMGQGLTDMGKRVAVELGRRIPITRKAHIFLSIVPRCYETAEAISNGFSEEGGEVVDMDAIATLIGPEYTDRSIWNNLHPNGENVTEFVNKWSDDEFEGIEPFDKFSARLMDDTVKRLRTTKENTMHIHVTHDLALMCTKRILLNRPLTRDDRVPFLGGLGVTVVDGALTLFSSGTTTTLDANL